MFICERIATNPREMIYMKMIMVCILPIVPFSYYYYDNIYHYYYENYQ